MNTVVPNAKHTNPGSVASSTSSRLFRTYRNEPINTDPSIISFTEYRKYDVTRLVVDISSGHKRSTRNKSLHKFNIFSSVDLDACTSQQHLDNFRLSFEHIYVVRLQFGYSYLINFLVNFKIFEMLIWEPKIIRSKFQITYQPHILHFSSSIFQNV